MVSGSTAGVLEGLRTLYSEGALGALPDPKLVELLLDAADDRRPIAFEVLLGRYGPMVLGVCRRAVSDPHAAEDVFQATFLVLLAGARSLRKRGAVGPWLHTVAVRLARRQRASARRTATAMLPADLAVDAAPDAALCDLRAVFDEELARLPAKYREPIVLCYLEGRTQEEAARELGWSKGTVSGRVARAKELLRDRLARRGLGPLALLLGASVQARVASASVPPALARATLRTVFLHLADQSGPSTGASAVARLADAELRATVSRKLAGLTSTVLVGGAVSALVLFTAAVAGPTQGPVGSAEKKAGVGGEPGGAAPPPAEVPAKLSVGRVIDVDGNPIGGALVLASGMSRQAGNGQVVMSEQDGRFTVREGDVPFRLFIAYKRGFSADCIFKVPERPAEDADLTLVLGRPAPFIGEVLDAEGRPVAGAEVRIRQATLPPATGHRSLVVIERLVAGTPLDRIFLARTDGDGRFRFDALSEGARARLAVSADGMESFDTLSLNVPPVPGVWPERPGPSFLSGSEDAPARIALQRAARIAGRIVTRLPEIRTAALKVGVQGTSGRAKESWKEAVTDADGRFVIDGLPSGTVNVFLLEHPSAGAWTYRAAANAVLASGKACEVEIELIEGALAEGRMVDAQTGGPVAGVGVGVYGPIRPTSGAAIISTRTDEDGRYRFRLPPGDTRFYVCGPVPAGYLGAHEQRSSVELVIPEGERRIIVPTLDVRRANVPNE